jgi:hypothetical protein
MKAPNCPLDRNQLEFVVEIILSAAFNTVDANLEDMEGKDENDIAQHAITQAGWALSTLYYQITQDGMGVADAVGMEFLKGKDLDSILQTFASKKARDNDHKRPDTAFLAHHWTNRAFNRD